MNFMRYNKAKKRPQRLNTYNCWADLAKPHETGLLASESDFDMGTPSLERKENIIVMLSNEAKKETILLKMNWRPDKESGLVTMKSSLSLVVDRKAYECELLESYSPTLSPVYPNRIMQYGSNGSRLKFMIANPYRRMRIVFRGHMREKLSNGSIFVKINLIINPTCRIFDFDRQFDQQYFEKMYEEKHLTISKEEAMSNLLFQDRHEQLVHGVGECQVGINGNDVGSKRSLFVWGFHARQFLDDKSQLVKTKRLMCLLNNGQAFHLANVKRDEKNELDSGFVCFWIKPNTEPIDSPCLINWDQVELDAQEIFFEVGSRKLVYRGEMKPGGLMTGLFEVTMNNKPGWVWLSINDAVESKEDCLAIERSLAEHKEALESGHLVKVKQLDLKEQPLVVKVTDAKCCHCDLVGSKAASLAQLRMFPQDAVNFEVPDAIVLTRYANDLIFEKNVNLREAVYKLEEYLRQGNNMNQLRQECEQVEQLIRDAPCPKEVHEALESSLKSLFGEDYQNRKFAVRSSSWGEDEEDMSSAGQLTTFLSVQGLDSLSKSIMSCFASKFTYANVEYKRQRGLSPNLAMAVVVQEMVDCEKAGVLFTCNPTTGNDEKILITANYGLGESVVSGESEPDTCIIENCSGNLLIQQVIVGEKLKIISGRSGDEIDHYDRSKCCLNDEEILSLAQCGSSLAKYYQNQRDIEWGIKDNRLYLFQSRPVTGLDNFSELELLHEADKCTRAEIEFCTRANMNEVMPFAIRPITLTYSVYQWLVQGFRIMSRLIPDVQYSPECISEIFYNSYHSFFGIRGASILPVSQGEKSLILKTMEISFFGHEVGDQPDIVEATKGLPKQSNPFQGSKFDYMTLPLRWFPKTTIMKEKKVAQRLRKDLKELKFAEGYTDNKMIGLLNQMRALAGYLPSSWENHIFIIMLGNANNVGLFAVLAKYTKDPIELFAVVTKILGTSPNVISAEIPDRIEKMANMIRKLGDASRFVGLEFEKCLEYIKENVELAKDYNEFIERFGHRCYNEFELSSLPWREDQSQIIDMLKKNCTIEAGGGHNKMKLTTIDQVLEALKLNEVMSFKDKWLIKNLIGAKAQDMTAYRELTKDILIEFTDFQRQATRALAQEMRRQLRLPDEDLFYYLMYDELEPLIRQPQPGIVVQATRRRNMFNKMFKDPWKYDEIIRGPPFIPDCQKDQKVLDESVANAPKLTGIPASGGRVQAKVSLVISYAELDKVRPGDILVTYSTDIGFSPVFPLVAGIVTEVGGLISHGAVVAREYGLPSLLGIPDVTRILEDGEEIILDADHGTITRLSKTMSKQEG